MGLFDGASRLVGRALEGIRRMGQGVMNAIGSAPTESARAKRLQALGDLYWGDQYEGKGLAPPWDKQPPGGRYIPLKHQKPSAQYDLPRLIVDRPTAMLFGEGRFPELALDPRPAGADVTEVNTWLAQIAEEGALQTAALAWARQGAALGTGVLTWAVVEGEFEFETHFAHHCIPEFHPRKRGRLVKLEKRYKFKKELREVNATGALVVKEVDYWHREEWTERSHIVYEDAPVGNGAEPTWTVRDEAVYNLPRVPAVWVKNLDDGDASDIDGVSLLDGLEDITEDIDRTLSQKSRAVRYNQDPERIYFGLSEQQFKNLSVGGGASTSLPPRPAGDVMLLEMQGEGQRIAEEHIGAQRNRSIETARIVAPDPERLLAAAKSSVALRILFSPMLELVGELRQSYGRALIDILGQILEAARQGKLAGLGSLATPPPAQIPPGKVALTWGKYFEPTPEDLQMIANAVVALSNANILDRETVIRSIATYFNIKDVENVLAKAEKEQQDKMAAETAALGERKPPPDEDADETDEGEGEE